MPPKTDHKAAAAGDAPQITETGPTPPTKASPLNAQHATLYGTDLLLLHAEDDNGEMGKVALEKWGKTRGNCHPEVSAMLLKQELLEVDGSDTVLTVAGWREVMKIQADRAKLALQTKDDELTAHKDYHAKEQKVLNTIKSCEATVESKKGALQAAKADLEAAHESLAALVAGGVQSSFLDKDKATIAQPKKESPIAPDWGKVLPEVKPESVRVWPVKACPEQKLVVMSLISPESMKQEKRKVEQVVEAFGVPWIVSGLWIEEKTGASRANLLPLLTKDEWQQLHEKDLGRAVDTFDQTRESAALRQRGGPWCGLVVKVGRKGYVVGPQSSAVHVVHPGDVKAEPKAAKK